ncbi:MAG TPA: hypothetical protein VIT65_22230 [Microlunatus sp.]
MERWWAPQRATMEPDRVVLAMLEPGDLGSSVLAVHRAGAAAIDTLRNGMVSETGLVEALTICRASVADQVVDSVAKNLEPSYAGLFVSDVFDDAEQGAISLYRTAVSKGVAPSIAVARVSDVFGVPAQLMGRYQAVATDPKTNPAAARDLADRTLLEYVSQLVATEQASVSKTVTTGEWDESEVNRDDQGRFATENTRPRVGTLEYTREQLGLTGAPAEIAGTPTRAPARAPARAQRAQRATRAPQRATLVPTGAPKQAVRRATPKQVVRHAARQNVARSINERANAVLERGAQDSQGVRGPQLTGDMLGVIDDDDADLYRPLYSVNSVVIRASLKDGNAFRHVLKDQASRFKDKSSQIFRIGHLEQTVAAHEPEQPGLAGDFDARKGLANTVKAPAQAYQDRTGLPWMDIDTERDSVVGAWSGMSAKQILEERAKRETSLKGGTMWTPDEVELQHALVVPMYTPYDNEDETDEWALVHFNAPNPNNPKDRVKPAVEEYILLGTPTGHLEQPSNNRGWDQIRLDPNAVYEVVAPPSAEPGAIPAAEQFWDKENRVIVNRWFLAQVSEDDKDDRLGEVGKADTHTFREIDVVRDEQGRFAEEPDTAPARAPVRAPARAGRAQRAQRAAPRQPPAALTSTVTPRRAAPSQVVRSATHQALHQAIHQAVREAEAELGVDPDQLDEATLSAHKGYKVLTQQQWNDAVQFTGRGQTELERKGKELSLNSLVRESLVNFESLQSKNVPFKMAMTLNSDPKLDQVASMVAGYLHMSEATLDNVAKKVADILTNHPKTAKVEIVRRGEVLEFSIPERNPSPQILIEVEPDLDWKKPVTLSYVGKFRARDMKVLTDAGIESLISSAGSATESHGFEGIVANPDIVYYRITSKHWRASN